jgi:hypothetical protein
MARLQQIRILAGKTLRPWEDSAMLSHVLWRVVENKVLPVTVKLEGACRRCGCQLQVVFVLRHMETKPESLRCSLCRNTDVFVTAAQVVRP